MPDKQREVVDKEMPAKCKKRKRDQCPLEYPGLEDYQAYLRNKKLK